MLTMDISNASTEAFVRYHRFHEQFNSTVQVSLAGMVTLQRIVDTTNGKHIMNSLVQSTNMPWPLNPRSSEPKNIIDKAIKTMGQMATVEAISAFDWFTLDQASNLAQFSPLLRATGPFNHAHTSVICDHADPVDLCICCQACATQYCNNHKLVVRLENMCRDLRISDIDIDNLLPLFHYFRLARNCVVHASGRASKEFVVHCQSTELDSGVAYWNNRPLAKVG